VAVEEGFSPEKKKQKLGSDDIATNISLFAENLL